MVHRKLSRRDVLRAAAVGAVAAAVPFTPRLADALATRLPDSKLPKPFTVPFARPPVLRPSGVLAGRPLYVLEQRPFTAQVLPGVKTTLWGYNGIAPGPTIRVPQGQPIAVRQINNLPQRHPVLGYQVATSTHLHGHPSFPQYDGYANDLTRPGQYKDYLYDNDHTPTTLWYHDHAAHITAQNVYMGLAAQYQLLGPEDAQLPQGVYEAPLMIGNVEFAADGELLYDDRGGKGVMGNVILVNGRPWPLLKVERRLYRFRLLNASVARSYLLRLSTGGPMTIIRTDDGFIPRPVTVDQFRVAMAERYEVLIDFSEYKIGQRVVLQNLPLPNNVEFPNTDKVMAFDVVAEPRSTANNTVPTSFPVHPALQLTEADSVMTRHLEFHRDGGLWVVNNLTWAQVEASGFTRVIASPALDAVEVWELTNSSGGWFHPVHVHLVDFKVLDRNGQPPAPYETGPKDVVYVGEGETVRILARFGPHQGRYMVHCHNTVHEDGDMMAQMQVGEGGPDPITAALPQPWPPPPR